MALAIASRYARALADVVLDPSAGTDPQAACGGLATFAELLAGSAELRSALHSPAVAPARKRDVVSRICEVVGAPTVIRNFLFVVINHRRLDLLDEIRRAFQVLLDEHLGMVQARVASARELTAEQRDAVAAQLSRLTGRKVRCDYRVEPALVGGLTARIGSTIYDGSVRGQLARLRRSLMD